MDVKKHVSTIGNNPKPLQSMQNKQEVKVYLSLPITGHNEMERRQVAARVAAELVCQHDDWQIINPFHIFDRLKAELLAAGIFEDPHYEDILQADLAVLETCHVACFLQGWEVSRGCQREMALCRDKGIEVIFR